MCRRHSTSYIHFYRSVIHLSRISAVILSYLLFVTTCLNLQEFMKMMGLRGWLHWSAWYIDFFSFNLISCALMTIVFSISTSTGKVLPFSDPSTIFILLVIYINSVICCNFAISTLFSKSEIIVIHFL